jgi:tRNA (guanine10-N2)-methyltransferase
MQLSPWRPGPFASLDDQQIAYHCTGPLYAPPDNLPVVVWELPASGVNASPYWYIHLPACRATKITQAIAQRSMLVRALIDLWGEGPTWEQAQAMTAAHDPVEKEAYAAEDQSFRFHLEAWGRKLGMEEKKAIVDSFAGCASFRGPINLIDAMHTWWAIEVDASTDTNMPYLPPWRFFGRQVVETTLRLSKLKQYDLKKRRYLGPTSMLPELAFIMCAAGAVRRSSLVFDPFVGTGSILVAAADCGALNLGTDIDMRVIRLGKKDKNGRGVNPWTNFDDYQLPKPVGLVRADLHLSPFRPDLQEWLDAVIADPPYGVRAGGRKSRSVPEMKIEDRSTHIASTAAYSLAECLRDLVEFAAKALTIRGRLVYWVPTAPGYYFESELPSHPCMETVANCEQMLTSKYGRRLIVMSKVKVYDAKEAMEHWEALGEPSMALDDMRDYVYTPLSNGGSQRNGDASPSSTGNGGGRSERTKQTRMYRNKYV